MKKELPRLSKFKKTEMLNIIPAAWHEFEADLLHGEDYYSTEYEKSLKILFETLGEKSKAMIYRTIFGA